jgi:hypothetical protein
MSGPSSVRAHAGALISCPPLRRPALSKGAVEEIAGSARPAIRHLDSGAKEAAFAVAAPRCPHNPENSLPVELLMVEARCARCGRRFLKRNSRHRFCKTCGPVARAARAARMRPRYGQRHQQLRRKIAREVAAGAATCARCGLQIDPGKPLDLDHAGNGASYLGPSHARCNRARNRPRPVPFPILLEDDPERGIY